MNASETDIVKAALTITRSCSPYSELAFIADIRAAVSHMLDVDRVDATLIALWQDGEIVLERADMVQGCADKVTQSELSYITETFHYAGLKQ